MEIIRTPRNKKPIRLGALSKPKVAKSSGPPRVSLEQGGGKSPGIKKREGIGPVRPLER